MKITQEKVLQALASVIEPDLKKDVVELGFVSDVEIAENSVRFKVQVNNPAMHSRKRMQEACEFAIERFLGKDVKIECEVVGAEKRERDNPFEQIKNIVAIASGKGGVGKSTITANLAVGLAKMGYKVGLIDADIYGPSIPLMFDVLNEKPKAIVEDGKNLMLPVENYGVKLLSIGFFAELNQAIVWRGPMASKAIKQMFTDTLWGELDFLLIDLPPGTGDIHLTMVQTVPLTAAVVVSTPQEVALADARKGIAMFKLESVNVPVLGFIENMAWFTPAELPENKYYIFGKEGVKMLAEQAKIPLLAQIPLVQSLRESGDVGRPAVLQEATPTSDAFMQLCENFIEEIAVRNASQPPTKKVEKTIG